jgi:hypothetical protein
MKRRAGKQADREIKRPTNRKGMNRGQTDGQTERQTNKQIEMQAYSLLYQGDRLYYDRGEFGLKMAYWTPYLSIISFHCTPPHPKPHLTPTIPHSYTANIQHIKRAGVASLR